MPGFVRSRNGAYSIRPVGRLLRLRVGPFSLQKPGLEPAIAGDAADERPKLLRSAAQRYFATKATAGSCAFA